jgi:hypothetical protein
MPGKIWWRALGLVILLAMSGGTVVLAYNVLLPLVFTAIMPMTSPPMAPICPGAPPCG